MSIGKNFSHDQLRLVTKVARLYHQRKLNQPEIAKRLDLSQARVSRALREAERLGIIRTTVHIPEGFFSDLELELEERYGLKDVVVVEPVGDDERDLAQALGDAAAIYLENIVPKCPVVGVSSWSETLLYAVNAMRPMPKSQTESIVQVLGGVGTPSAQGVATHLIGQLSRLSGAEAIYLLVPGLCTDASTRQAIMSDQSCRHVLEFFNHMSLLLMGVGTLTPSRYLRDSGNRMTEAEQAELARLGAVGDVCLHFINADGKRVEASFNSRVIGIGYDQMLNIPRRVGIAGGMGKFEAIRGVLRGGCLTTLVTDAAVAKQLAETLDQMTGLVIDSLH